MIPLSIKQKLTASLLWLVVFFALFAFAKAASTGEPPTQNLKANLPCFDKATTQTIKAGIEKRGGEVLAGLLNETGLYEVYLYPERGEDKSAMQLFLFLPDGTSCIVATGTPLTVNHNAGTDGI
jgi:hypothetical protein